ncbi:hypothetical protein Q4489_15585 [Thalassotalea sp. 1_MG-2023]|uniref:hypothetical protein n=1 Tax=Thalassotalea sp. 1_MG-2023 TaxID=3062680 RepID=UPI0026E1F993|nr:hypothetical protein [Thalassotalea sp. 1_MG-2023]MDO6428438.1 hypothetical protein [Thalassotalea sp. 1_MG-2023]
MINIKKMLYTIFAFNILLYIPANNADEFPVLTASNQIDVGNAQILAGKLEQICASRFTNPAQAFHCKSACGGLYKRVHTLSAQINRQANKPSIKNSVKQLARDTISCNQQWRNNFPAEFKPFALLLKSLHEGKLPAPGKPKVNTVSAPSQYAQVLNSLVPSLSALGNVCHNSLFKDSCLKSCALSNDTQQFSQSLSQGSFASIKNAEKMTPWITSLKEQSTKLLQKSKSCAKHYSRNPASSIVSLQKITQSVNEQVNAVYQKQLVAEKRAREEAKRQQQIAQANANAEKQKLFEQEVEKLRKCRTDSPFSGYKGCSYLTALYDNDFNLVMDIEYQSSAPYRLGWMGEANAEMAKMFGDLYGSEKQLNQDIANSWKAYHFVGRLLGTYATYYQHYFPSCLGENPAVVTLTTERQKEYRNGFGTLVRTERLPSKTDTIYIPRRLYPHVNFADINKDTQARVQIADMLSGAINKYPRINLFDVTMGLSEAMKQHRCDSDVIQKLEQQMLAYQQHRNSYNLQFSR